MRSDHRIKNEVEKGRPNPGMPGDVSRANSEAQNATIEAGWHERNGTERRHHRARAEDVVPETEEVHEFDGYHLHVFQADEDDGYVVWLNTEVSHFDGLVIGTGDTRDEAIKMAVATAEAIERILQAPPPARATV